MHGPYSAVVTTSSGEFTLDETEVAVGDRLADRFYQGAGVRTLVGFTRAATLTVATLLGVGEEAEVEIVGRVGTEGTAAARDCGARVERVRRDDRGRVVTTLGSRFGERVFNGV